jgi:LCP family protein required for cell wall assembly
MDSFRKHTPQNGQPKALDGFIRRPVGGTTTPALSHMRQRQRPLTSATPSSGRRIDGFGRTSGSGAAARRPLQSAGHAPEVSKTPHVSKSLAKQLNLDLPAETKKKGRFGRTKKTKPPLTRFQKFRRATFRTVGATMVLALIGGGFLFTKGYLKLNQMFQGGSSAAALESEVDPTLLKGEGDGRVNVLLLGAGGETHTGGDLTDTLMVASIDPVNSQAVLFSLPRDLWAKMPNNYVGNYNKINAAYESGKYGYLGKQVKGNADRKAVLAGFQGIDSAVERISGIPIHYNMLVDFKAFSQAVDTVGGVTVNAPEELRDPTMAWENGWKSTLAVKGPNTFNGKQALNYVRSRHTSSDFARGERQRIVMMALKEKSANLGTLSNPMKLSGMLNAFGDNIQSDISISDMARMASIMKKIPSTNIQSVGLADPGNSFVTTGNINGMSVVMPKAGLEDYTKIQAYLRSKLKDGYIARENATITILNGSGVAGLGAQKADELKSYGYNVGVVDNAPTDDYTETKVIDLTNGSKKYTLNYLKKRLGVNAINKQVPTGIVAGAANIVIILGNDAATNINAGSSN